MLKTKHLLGLIGLSTLVFSGCLGINPQNPQTIPLQEQTSQNSTCACEDLNYHMQLASTGEEAWKEVFAWARGLHNDIPEPKSNDELSTKFVQLMRTPRSNWDRIMHEPIKKTDVGKKIGGLDKNGEPVIDANFEQNQCSDIVEAVRVHERAHKDFYLSPGNVLEAGMSSRLLRLRAESEVVAHRAQKNYLQEKIQTLCQKPKMAFSSKSRSPNRYASSPNAPSSVPSSIPGLPSIPGVPDPVNTLRGIMGF